MSLYVVVWGDGMMGADTCYVPTLGAGAMIIFSTFDGAGASTLCGAIFIAFFSAIGSTPVLFRRY